MVKACGNVVLEIVISIKANIRMIKNLDMVYLHGQLVMSIKVIINLMYEMDMVKCIGVMGAIIKVNGEMEYNTDKDKFMYLVKDLKKGCFKIMYLLSWKNNLIMDLHRKHKYMLIKYNRIRMGMQILNHIGMDMVINIDRKIFLIHRSKVQLMGTGMIGMMRKRCHQN